MLHSPIMPFIIMILSLLINLYFLKKGPLLTTWQVKLQKRAFRIFYGLNLSGWLLIVFESKKGPAFQDTFFLYLFSLLILIFLSELLAFLCYLLDDIRRILLFTLQRFPTKHKKSPVINAISISRSSFLKWLGFISAGLFLTTTIKGFSNKYNYKIRKINLRFPDFPACFDGLKIVQISDIHSGSLTDKKAVEKGISMIMAEKADLIVFTGDLVNRKSHEILPLLDSFKKIKAPMGVYSILGNHDYGDYDTWKTADEKRKNFINLLKAHKDLGWDLLRNENRILRRPGGSIALMGSENWGKYGNLPQYGNMDLTTKGTEITDFQILMTHDPTHWDEIIVNHYKKIRLTLSGHTHGMQFGIDNPYIQWSPAGWIYPEWAGLYQKGEQYIYVNRGFGFIGYPGRVGVMPEITSFTFHRK